MLSPVSPSQMAGSATPVIRLPASHRCPVSMLWILENTCWGVHFTPGDTKRLPGWMQVHYRLSFDENGYPGLYVFRSCKAFIRTLPLLQYDAHSPEDVDTDGEDHIADETRYFCMSRPVKPPAAPAPKAGRGPVQQFLDIPREEIKAACYRPGMEIIE